MPELPEVETIRRVLQSGTPASPPLPGKRICRADLRWERTLAEPALGEFHARIVGQTVTKLGRRAKYLLVHLNEDTLIIHLRMSGDLRVQPGHAPIAKHDRFLLHFEDGDYLAFNDTRKFGRIWLLVDPAPLLSKLGPEPLADSLTPDIFHARLQNRRRQLKPLLLDQGFIAGLGNIYTDEALYRARLHPRTPSDFLTPEQAAALLTSIRAVLRAGIEANGASIDWVYRGGGFQNQFQVYQRTGEPCGRCGTPIERILVGQRSTHFCPHCQPSAR